MPSLSLSKRAIDLRKRAAAVAQQIQELPQPYRAIVQDVLDEVSGIAGEVEGLEKRENPCPRARKDKWQHIEPLLARLLEQQRSLEDGGDPYGLATQKMAKEWSEELLAAYEELRVAQEELCQQSDELVMARYDLEAERQRYVELFDFAPDGYLVTNLEGVIQAANRQAAALLDIGQAALVGKPLATYVGETDLPYFFGLLSALREDGSDRRQAEMRLKLQGGQAFDAALTVAPVEDATGDGRHEGLRWIVRDVTEEVQSRQALHRSRQEFRALVENAPDIIARFDREFRHLYLNLAIEQYTHLPRETMIGKTNRELGMPDDLATQWEAELRVAFETGEQRRVPLTIAGEDGDLHLEARLAPEFAPDGTVQSLLAVVRNVTDEVHNVQQLELERARLKTVIDTAPQGILVADAHSRLVLSNPAADAVYGQSIPYGEEDSTRGRLGFCHADGTPYDPRDLPLTRAALDGETQNDVEMGLVRPNGQRRTLLVNAAPIRDAEDQLTGAVAVLQDVTEARRTTEILHRYAERLQVLRDVDRLILAAGSAEEIAELVLPRARQMLPCRRASVVLFDIRAGVARLLGVDAEGETALPKGTEVPLHGAWPLEELERGESYVERNVCASRHRSPVVRRLCREGVRVIANVPLIADGKLLGALNLGLGGDTELTPDQLEVAGQLAATLAVGIQQARLHGELKRRAEDLEVSIARRTAALQASEARFRTIFEDSATGMALLDPEGRILASNPALQNLLGFTARELQTKTFDDLTHPDDVARGHALYEELLAGNLDHYNLEKRYIHNDGRTVWVRPTVSLVRRTRGGPQYAIKTIEDVTEQKKAREALIQAEKLTIAGQLGASMAHEINNPLQAVIGCLGLAEETLVEGGDVGLYLRIAREELRRAARIVSQLRDLHRPSDPEEREPTDVNDLLEQVLVLVRKQMETRHIEMAWSRREALPLLHLVPDRVRQVFLNVLLNAADAMPDGGRLQIETTLTENPAGVSAVFYDTGQGIGPEVLPHLFEPFFSTKPEGVGLGMFISQRIVGEHKGQIKVESQPGEGTTVTIWLPLEPGDDGLATYVQEKAESVPGEEKKPW